jgi:hypothetical protein
LKRFGLDIEKSKDGKILLVVSTKHPELVDYLEKKGFSTHHKLLKRIPGAASSKTRNFGGVTTHSITVPVNWGFETDDAGDDAAGAKGVVSAEEIMREVEGIHAKEDAADEDW